MQIAEVLKTDMNGEKTAHNKSRYIIGIDLGTTNCAVSFIDTLSVNTSNKAQIFPLPQLYSLTAMTSSTMLPSYTYLPLKEELEVAQSAEDLSKLLIEGKIVGSFAKNALPDRVITSAKSWLCNDQFDREERFLPWASETIPEHERLSPVDVCAFYLRSIKESWNTLMAKDEALYGFDEQEVIITVPASFDEYALSLTNKAAVRAGYPEHILFIEEPQAAFYHILEDSYDLYSLIPSNKQEKNVLVIDIGGGTTDLSLFTYNRDKSLKRTAVGSHILLGGDNMDLALCHSTESKMKEKPSVRRWKLLLAQARTIKEKALETAEYTERLKVILPSEGGSLFSTPLTIDIEASEIREALLNGFFPLIAKDIFPEKKRSGLKEAGLHYATDSAVTKHIAAFLKDFYSKHHEVDALLFTGGALKPQLFRERILQVITSWQNKEPFVINNPSMDLAVSLGASRYGFIKRTDSEKIESGYPHSVYLEVPNPRRAVCILPYNAQTNSRYSLEDLTFKAAVGKPVHFQLFYSPSRREDRPGDVISLDQGFHYALEEAMLHHESLETDIQLYPLPPVTTVIGNFNSKKTASTAYVIVNTKILETGRLVISCTEKDNSIQEWFLDFNLRSFVHKYEQETNSSLFAKNQKNVIHDDSLEKIEKAKAEILKFYGKPDHDLRGESPKGLFRKLEKILQTDRIDWSLYELRALWSALSQGITKRHRSKQHETVWLALSGYCLRPGYGEALDEIRMRELWRITELGLAFPKEHEHKLQNWIMMRRVAGGLDRSQQEVIFKQISKVLFEEPEAMRLCGNLERLPVALKKETAERMIDKIRTTPHAVHDALFWTLGRLVSRVTLYGGKQSLIDPQTVYSYFQALENLDWSEGKLCQLVKVFKLTARLTSDRSVDLDVQQRERILQKLIQAKISSLEIERLKTPQEIDREDEKSLFGEALPHGLQLIERQ
jgi:molecular chaperone DnaK (HSP70)